MAGREQRTVSRAAGPGRLPEGAPAAAPPGPDPRPRGGRGAMPSPPATDAPGARSDTSTAGRILAAALVHFARRGVAATSLDHVAAAVGVRKQTLLYWFPSKDDLVRGVIDHAVAELGQVLDAATAGGRSGQDPAVAVVDAVLRLGADRPDLLVLLREVTRLGPPATGALAAAVGPRLDGAAVALADRPDDPASRARARRRVVEAGARVVATALEAELMAQMGVEPDRAWLRHRRAELLATVRPRPGPPPRTPGGTAGRAPGGWPAGAS